MATSKTIVLIHGNFVNNTSWSEWKPYFEQKGYKVYSPVNPGHEGNPGDLRAKVHPDLIKTGFIDIINKLVQLIDTLPEKPLIIEISFLCSFLQGQFSEANTNSENFYPLL